MNLNFYNKLTDYIEAERIYREEPMKKHTTFRIGGPADYFYFQSGKRGGKDCRPV